MHWARSYLYLVQYSVFFGTCQAVHRAKGGPYLACVNLTYLFDDFHELVSSSYDNIAESQLVYIRKLHIS